MWMFISVASATSDYQIEELSQSPASRSILPEQGSSLVDQIFQKTLESGEVVYDIPYPFDRFMGRVFNRPGYKRILSQRKALKDTPSLLSYLRFDMDEKKAFAHPEKFQPQFLVKNIESLFPFGRSLQKPRLGGPIAKPFLSPREIFHYSPLEAEVHMELGPLHSKIYCGHVEDLNQIECISYNEEALPYGRFEFQIIKNYLPDTEPEVYYVPPMKCMGCHLAGLPIFPDASWLESDDNLLMESAGIWAQFSAQNDHVSEEARKKISEAFGLRIRAKINERQLHGRSKQLNLTERGREFHQARPKSTVTNKMRVMNVKNGSFDVSVKNSEALHRAQQFYHILCPLADENVKACRLQILEVYLIKLALESISRHKKPSVAMTDSFEALIEDVSQRFRHDDLHKKLKAKAKDLFKEETSEVQSIFEKLQSLRSISYYETHFYDRDPILTLLKKDKITFPEISECLQNQNNSCPLSLFEKITDPESIKLMVAGGEDPDYFHNLRYTPQRPYLMADEAEFKLLEHIFNGFDILFEYMSYDPKFKKVVLTHDLKKLIEQNISISKNQDFPTQAWPNKVEILMRRLRDQPEVFFKKPLQRSALLRALNPHQDSVVKKTTPEKQVFEIHSPYEPSDEHPILKQFYQSCSACHGVRGEGGPPQFIYAENAGELRSNLALFSENIFEQLRSKKMPQQDHLEDEERLSEAQRLQMLEYIQDLK